jgi:endoglucanase
MLLLRRTSLLLVVLLSSALIPGGARAASFDASGFRLASSSPFVHENAGNAIVTIERGDSTGEAQIRYMTLTGSAVRSEDYTPLKAMIDFQPGQASATFQIPIVDHHMPGLPRTIKITLFGPSPIGLGAPSSATLTILNDDPLLIEQDPHNPLGLAAVPPAGDLLTGASPFVDWASGLSAVQARSWRYSHPRSAGMLDVIAREPEVHRFGNWSGADPGLQVSQYMQRASIQEPGTVPELSTYYLVNGHCGSYSDPAWRQGAYHKWIQGLAQGVGDNRAIVFLEMDSLITVGCLSRHGLQVRVHELHDAIGILSKVPRLAVYLDAGAADAVPAAQTAGMLRRAGVSRIQGFFVNSTHFDWTSREIRYGEQISRMTGGKHFVVSTSANGRGPLVPASRVRDGNEVLCNPPGRGLGPLPTFTTRLRNVDAFAWIGNPGRSGGQCRPGAPPTGVFWPQEALSLVRNADFRVR